MKNLVITLSVAVLLATLTTVAQAQNCNGPSCQTGASSYAVRLNSIGRLVHDRSYRGPEVIYWSSGPASEAEAMAAWKRSPGHARLVNSGQITEVSCQGNYCVGRGSVYSVGLPKPTVLAQPVVAAANVTRHTVNAVACTTRRVASNLRYRLRCFSR
jgi:hypothetical protein